MPAGEIAAVVTYLEMHAPPAPSDATADLRLQRLGPDLRAYRALFRKVGSRWLWFSRLVMADDKLAGILQRPGTEVYAVVDPKGEQVGMLELDFSQGGECELAYVGLVPELAGRGLGRWLLTEALRLAWRDGVQRVHVHTCTLDHPAALGAYRRAGFHAYRRAVERFPDPRLSGLLPPDCAPQVPVVGTLASASPAPAS